MRSNGLAFLLLAASAIILAPSPTVAAEPANGDLAKAVEAACRAAAATALDDISVKIDPAGSAHYGLALLSGTEKGTPRTRSVICAYDRETRRTEVGSPMDLGNATTALSDFPVEQQAAPSGTAATLIYPGSPTCGQDCLANWTALSTADQNQLIALPEQVRRTLQETANAGAGQAGMEAARAAASSVIAAAAGQPDNDTATDLAKVAPGERQCTVYHFGYRNEGIKQVASDRCRVDRLASGGLNLVRLSGDNLTLQMQLLENGLAVAGGRDAPAGPPPGGYDLSRPVDPVNTNYGNLVGLGIARPDGRVYVASIEERQLDSPDPTFFLMIAVDTPKRK